MVGTSGACDGRLARRDRDDADLALLVVRQQRSTSRSSRRRWFRPARRGTSAPPPRYGTWVRFAPVAALKRASVMCDGAADAGGAERDLLLLRQRDQLRHGLRRHRVVQHDRVRREVGEPDGDEVLERIVAELGLHERIDGQRAVRAGEQRVAIGRRRSRPAAAPRLPPAPARDSRPRWSGRASATCPRRRAAPPDRRCRRPRTARSAGSACRDRRRKPARGSSEASGVAASVGEKRAA